MANARSGALTGVCEWQKLLLLRIFFPYIYTDSTTCACHSGQLQFITELGTEHSRVHKADRRRRMRKVLLR